MVNKHKCWTTSLPISIRCGPEKGPFCFPKQVAYLLPTLGVAVFLGRSTAWMLGRTPP